MKGKITSKNYINNVFTYILNICSFRNIGKTSQISVLTNSEHYLHSTWSYCMYLQAAEDGKEVVEGQHVTVDCH